MEQACRECSVTMASTKLQPSYIDRSRANLQLHELPEDILHKILTQLTFKEIVRTSILCTQWKHIWRSYPDLKFCRDMLNVKSDIPLQSNHESVFVERVNSIIKHHRCPRLDRFKVSFGLHKGHKDHLDGWIRFSVDSKSKSIILNLTPAPECLEDVYSFPLHLFQEPNSCFVESLKLVLVFLRPSPGFCGLRNLKRIVLHRVMLLRDLHCVLSACALLEFMRLTDCFLSGFTLCQPLVHLHHLCIENCHVKSMELHAPNLTSFQFQQREMPIILDELLLLKEADIEIQWAKDSLDYAFNTLLSAMPNLATLNLSLYIQREAKGWEVSPCDFIHLRHLKMDIHLHGPSDCSSGLLRLVSFLHAAPILEEMEMHMCICDAPSTPFTLSKNGPQVKHGHLKTVYITGFYGCKCQVELARYILENATRLQHMTVDPVSRILPSYAHDVYTRYKEAAGRRNAKSYLDRRRFRRILTIL